MLTSWIQSDNKALVLVGAVVALSCILAWVSRFAPLRHAPGPWLNKYCGVEIAIAEIRGRRSQQIVAWHKQYGPIVCIAPTQVSIASLPTIRDIYSSTGRADKNSFFNHFVSFNSRSVFTTLSFPDHKRKRAVVAAFFQGTNIHGQPSIEAFIRTHALAILSQIEKRRPQAKSIDFYPLADWYAFDNITALVLGPLYASTVTKQPCKEREMLQDLKRARAWSALQQRFPWLIPIMKIAVRIYNGNTDQFEAEDRLAEWTHDRVLRSLQDCNVLGFDNLVVYLARKLGLNPGPGIRQDAQNSNNHKLVNYIAAETLDNINAAESSVAATITYVIWYMSIHPEWQQRLRAELLALPVESDGLPSFNDIDRAPILDACLKEVYRLKPASGGRAERVVPTGGRVVSDVYVPEKVTSLLTGRYKHWLTFCHLCLYRPWLPPR